MRPAPLIFLYDIADCIGISRSYRANAKQRGTALRGESRERNRRKNGVEAGRIAVLLQI